MRSRLTCHLATLCLLAACSGESAEHAAAARRAFAGEDFAAARFHLAEALGEDPGDPELLEMLARTRLALGEYDATIATLDRLKQQDRLPPDASLLYAEAELWRGRPEAAVDRLENDLSAPAWRIRAIADTRMEDEIGARAAYAAGLAASGPKARLRTNQAHFLLDRDDIVGARLAINAALAEEPDLTEGILADARVARAEGRAEAALAAYSLVLDRLPQDRQALVGAITVLGEAGRIEELTPLVTQGRAAMPGDPEFAYFDARLAAEQGEWAKVRDLLRTNEGWLSQNPEADGLYAQSLLEAGLAGQASARLAPLHARWPDHPAIRRLYARALLAQGDNAGAAEIIAPLAASGSKRPEDMALLAEARGAN